MLQNSQIQRKNYIYHSDSKGGFTKMEMDTLEDTCSVDSLLVVFIN